MRLHADRGATLVQIVTVMGFPCPWGDLIIATILFVALIGLSEADRNGGNTYESNA